MTTFIDNLNAESFSKEFLEGYLQNGFTTLGKREIDLLVLQLLLKHVDSWNSNSPDAFSLAQQLRAKRGKIRSMLDELSFREAGDDENTRNKIKEILINAEKDIEKNKVKFQIDDAYLREYAKQLIRSDYGIVDTSFDRTVITVSGDKFLALALELAGDEERAKIEEEFKNTQEAPKNPQQPLTRILFEEFVKSAGKEAGSKAIKLGAAALTGGLSEIPELINSIMSLCRPTEENDS